uniref:Cytochrome P450 n=1 Tax=Oryza glumipatula TaxID=40148 RepID=A0A0D9Y4Q9_9ORYZ
MALLLLLVSSSCLVVAASIALLCYVNNDADERLPPGPRRRRSVDRLVATLELEARAGAGATGVVAPTDAFRHGVFSFFAVLCFGEWVRDGEHDAVLRDLRRAHADILALTVELGAFHLVPAVLMVPYLHRWWKLSSLQRSHRDIVAALISVRRRLRREKVDGDDADSATLCYVDTLLELELGEDEMVSLCWEFMNAAAKTTSTALEWTMARLVHHSDIQRKLRHDIAKANSGGVSPSPYLKAVVQDLFASTRRRTTCWRTREPLSTAWMDPDEFLPEQFMEGGEDAMVDAVSCGGAEIRMMPFGAGRRACPGASFAVSALHLFVGRLVEQFEWWPVAEDEKAAAVDFSEKTGLVTVMKTPLRALLVPTTSSS